MRSLLIICIIVLSFLTVSAVNAQANIRPAELQQMMSILKFINDKLEKDTKGLSQQLRLNTMLESLELLGIDSGNRSRFKPGMSDSQISVLLLGEQLPAKRQVAIQNAISVLNLKTDTEYRGNTATYKPAPAYVKQTLPKTYGASQRNYNPATVKTGQKAQPRVGKPIKPGSLTPEFKRYIDLDDIVFKAVENATKTK